MDTETRLEETRCRIEEWRQKRAKIGPMPKPIWDEVKALAEELGPNRVARVLRLNYGIVQQRLAEKHGGFHPTKGNGATFLEVKAPVVAMGRAAGAVATECAVVEVVAADGARLTIRLKGPSPDFSALVASFR